MPSAADRIKAKYGLTVQPNSAQANVWAQATRAASAKGSDMDYAAEAAAKMIFGGITSRFGSSDPVSSILAAVERGE